jgi:DNA-binding FadR family transcriptional regulator
MLGTLLRGLRLADSSWHNLVRSALEIRRILAAEAVALAAERHTAEDLDAIAACAQVLCEHVDEPVAFARADLAFMRAVCKAARNVGLELFLNTFARWPDEHPELVAVLYDDCARAASLYPSVIDLIRTRDGEAARTLGRKALEQIDEAWSRRHPPPGPSVASAPSDVSPVKNEPMPKAEHAGGDSTENKEHRR